MGDKYIFRMWINETHAMLIDGDEQQLGIVWITSLLKKFKD